MAYYILMGILFTLEHMKTQSPELPKKFGGLNFPMVEQIAGN